LEAVNWELLSVCKAVNLWPMPEGTVASLPASG
jgi:hypothetical protein